MWRAIVVVASLTVPAATHESWISRENLRDPVSNEHCCGTYDCKDLPAGAVEESHGGFLVVETGEVIERARVLWRQPHGGWTRCVYLSGPNVGKTRCLIGPPRGM